MPLHHPQTTNDDDHQWVLLPDFDNEDPVLTLLPLPCIRFGGTGELQDMLSADALSFLENALDRDFYVPKKFCEQNKPPIRVLVTDAGDKIAYNLIYKLCSGIVFGPDQEVILHLNNSRGAIHHRDIANELFECGFPCYKDFVVSSDPSVIYKDLDFIVLVATYEEIPGWVVTAAFTYQMIKARQVARYAANFAKPDCKIVLTGPSTKALVTCLGTFRQFAPKIPESNITCVTCLDEFIGKAELAAKLKITTTRVKNVVVWNTTYPDIYYATVRMTPPGDVGGTKMIDVPVSEAIDDGEWLHKTFRLAIFRRILTRDLLKYGKAVALATAHHLRVLYKGTDSFDEIQSMGLISPPDQLYGLPSGRGFSFPVKVRNGKPEILQARVDTATFLNRLRTIYSMADSYVFNSSLKILVFLMDYESCKKQMISFQNAMMKADESYESKTWFNKYFITPNPAEEIAVAPKDPGNSKKSIAWVNAPPKLSGKNQTKSSNKINFEDGEK